MIALGGSLSFAVLMLITRSLRATPDIVLASSQFAGTFLLGALMSPFGWVTPGLGSLGLFATAGCISVGALLCVNRSLKLAPASVVVPYQYSMIVWAVMFGYLVFGDVPSAPTDGRSGDHHRRRALHFPARAQTWGAMTHESARRFETSQRAEMRPPRSLARAPGRTAPVLQRRPDAARETEAIDRRRRSQRHEPMQLDATPLETALLQNVARGRVGDPRARDQLLDVELLEAKSITARAASVPKPWPQ